MPLQWLKTTWQASPLAAILTNGIPNMAQRMTKLS